MGILLRQWFPGHSDGGGTGVVNLGYVWSSAGNCGVSEQRELEFSYNQCYRRCWLENEALPQNSDNKPWAYICSKGFFAGLIFGGAYFRRGLLLDGILRFKMGLSCQ